MGMETLNSAARAAGFAMAASDEPYGEVETGKYEAVGWHAPVAVLRAPAIQRPPRAGDWLRGMFSLFGRRAPASPA
jgi:hypothetical protein